MNLRSFVNIVLIYIYLQHLPTESESTCVTGNEFCKCTFGSYETKVNCSGLGLKQLPTGIPRNTTNLDLSNNELEQFDNDTFLQFPGLRQIRIRNNKITKIPKFAESLQDLILTSNKISNFDNDTLLQYHHLKKLDFRGNNLTQIPTLPASLETIILDSNPLEKIEPYTFFKIKLVQRIRIGPANNLKEIKENSFALTSVGISATITLGGKSLSKIASGAFKNIPTYGQVRIKNTNVTKIPARLIQGTSVVGVFELSFSKIYYIDPDAFKDQKHIIELYLNNNMLTEIPLEAMNHLIVKNIFDLSWNNISSLGVGPILSQSPLQIYLAKNQIQNISRDNFSGLYNVSEINLLENKITHIADGAFRDTNLLTLLLQSNLLSTISEGTLNMKKSKKLDHLYIYDNPLQKIEDNALSNMAVNSTTYLECEILAKLPAVYIGNVYCVTNKTDIVFNNHVIHLEKGRNRLYGMVCNDKNQCRPCKQGHYGYVGSSKVNECFACPPGGFYQDKIGYADLGDYTANCKGCPPGSFSPSAGAPSIIDCKPCPSGTNTDKEASLNACECLDKFHRTYRYGPCQPCPVGVNCTDGVQRLMQGWWWSWSAMGNAGNLTEYDKFASDMKDNHFDIRNPNELNITKYHGKLPAVHTCPRNESCLGGGFDGNCSDGYSGWLCAACSNSYYELFNKCHRCQNIAVIITVFVVITIVLAVTGYIVYKLNKRGNVNDSMTSFFTHIKITINFYQILGILSEVNEINWPDDFQSVGQSLQYLDIIRYINILSPKCIFPGSWNAYTLLYIAIATPFIIVILASIVFFLWNIFYRCKHDHSVHNIKDKFLSVTIMMLYLTYANTCSNIMAVGPWSIRKFDVTATGSKKISILTSDYSIDVEQDDGAVYNIHKNIVYISLIYVVSFPLIVVVVLYFKYKRKNIDSTNVTSDQSENFGLLFFFKQYTRKFWYWEVFEMYNKSVLAFIANFKYDQASNMSYSLFVTVVLIASHLYLEPIKNKSDHRFKLLTLCFIVVNLSVGAIVDLDTILYTEDDSITFLHDITPIILLLINFSILFLLLVDFIKKIKEDIWDSLKHHSAPNNTTEIESDNNDDVMPFRYHDAASCNDEELLDI